MSPLLYLSLLAAAVGLGMPAGALVVGAGALFGPGLGLAMVLLGQTAGLLLNWRLCRGLLRPRVRGWLQRRQKQGRWSWVLRLQQSEVSLGVLVLLRLAAIPMTLVNVGCALGPTPARTYALASLMLVPRFALMVLAGGAAAAAGRGSLDPLQAAVHVVHVLALLATAALLALLARWALRRQHPGH